MLEPKIKLTTSDQLDTMQVMTKANKQLFKGEEKMNNRERSQWIENDEGLYCWWKSSRQSKAKFIQENRTEIDKCIENVTGNTQPAHYLKYGG